MDDIVKREFPFSQNPSLEAGALLKAERVGYGTGAHLHLVRNVTLALPKGSTTAIIGPNGAGKTTLLRLLSGELRPSSGEVFFHDRPLYRLAAPERARGIAIVGQNSDPDPRLSVFDYAALGRIPHARHWPDAGDCDIIRGALERVGVDRLAGRTMGSLSGGERQRVFLARALAQQPEILFLDEPTNHLDPRGRSDLLALVRSLGVTAVVVLHDLAQVAPFAERVAVMSGGMLLAHGSPAEVLTPAIIRDVFRMDVFRIAHPASGMETLFFDSPPLC